MRLVRNYLYIFVFISGFNYKGRLFQVKQTFASVSRKVKLTKHILRHLIILLTLHFTHQQIHNYVVRQIKITKALWLQSEVVVALTLFECSLKPDDLLPHILYKAHYLWHFSVQGIPSGDAPLIHSFGILKSTQKREKVTLD